MQMIFQKLSYGTSHLTDNDTDDEQEGEVKVSLHHVETRDLLACDGGEGRTAGTEPGFQVLYSSFNLGKN